ncbi:MAG: hypothetical protein LBR11_07915 [Deltaproteobacteria bacterium]|nr:hypothetical protein [Deltaproteobacteria bacterium]
MAPTSSKIFNVAGHCLPSKHYMLPALPRLPDIQGLIDREQYFVLHAPRQSGKTTVIRQTVNSLNENGSYHALYCSLETFRDISRSDEAMSNLVGVLHKVVRNSKSESLKKLLKTNF